MTERSILASPIIEQGVGDGTGGQAEPGVAINDASTGWVGGWELVRHRILREHRRDRGAAGDGSEDAASFVVEGFANVFQATERLHFGLW